jgi:hypothetical protein
VPASKREPLSLDEFAEANGPKRGSYIDTLPEALRTELLASSAAPRVAALWLHSLGHKGASPQMVYEWRRKNGYARR